MITAVYLSTDISKTEVVSSLKMAYSSEGVPTLNVADKIEFLKLSALCYSPTKSKKQRWPIFDGLLAHRR